MTTVELWSLLLGTFLPLLVAVIQQRKWPDWVRVLVTVVISIIVGIGNVAVQGQLEFDNSAWVKNVLLVLLAAVAAFKGIWQPSRVTDKIEAKTSPNTSKTG